MLYGLVWFGLNRCRSYDSSMMYVFDSYACVREHNEYMYYGYMFAPTCPRICKQYMLCSAYELCVYSFNPIQWIWIKSKCSGKKSMEHSFIQTDWVKERFDWISNDMTIVPVRVEMICYFIVYNHYDYHLACCYKYELLTIDIFIRRIDFQFYGFCFSWTFHLSLYLCFLFWFVRTERTRVRFDILIHRREWIGSIVVETLCFSL